MTQSPIYYVYVKQRPNTSVIKLTVVNLCVSGEAAVEAFSFVSHFLKASFFQTKLSKHETVEGKGERKRQREAGTQKRIYGE